MLISSFIASVIWSSAFLTSGSLKQNVTDVSINKGESDLRRECVQMDNILNTFYELLVTAKKES